MKYSFISIRCSIRRGRQIQLDEILSQNAHICECFFLFASGFAARSARPLIHAHDNNVSRPGSRALRNFASAICPCRCNNPGSPRAPPSSPECLSPKRVTHAQEEGIPPSSWLLEAVRCLGSPPCST